MKRGIKAISLVLVGVFLFAMCGCQQAPESRAVVSKNDGSFDRNVVQSKESPRTEQEIKDTRTFQSSDGSVSFAFHLQDTVGVGNDPVVEVIPHYLSEEDARRVATALLGNADFYEQEPILNPRFSKKQLQEQIDRWSAYANSESIQSLYGDQVDTAFVLDLVKKFIADDSARLDTAPDGDGVPCKWSFQKEGCYSVSAENLTPQDAANDNDAIQATAKVGNVEYIFSVSTRKKPDYKLNNIFLRLSSGSSPNDIDARIYQAELCRTGRPTELEISQAEEKAQSMLDNMELGTWKVDRSQVQTAYYGDIAEYVISVDAVPVLCGAPAVRVPQLGNLKSTEVYASNYYISDANFQFSASGDLIAFSMYAPVEVKQVINENILAMDLPSVLDLACQHLQLSDLYAYGMGEDSIAMMQEAAGEDISCKVNVGQLQYGLLRVKAPNMDESYYYVPGVVLSGEIDYVGKKTGTVYASSGTEIWNERTVPLVAINAVDGSIVELYIG